MTYLIYPGATHKRFEHSLGVMELAGRVFDIVTNPDNITDQIKGSLSEINSPDVLMYWRRVLRMAALCHDIGHLPFSHAAENELLPDGWNHEKITREIINSDDMKVIWERITPPLRPEDIVKLAVGQKEATELTFSDWETILSEIIVGDAFGVDRIDYLLRDSHHTGVGYGKFDHYRLIDTLRILPTPDEDTLTEPTLGIEAGGIQSAEALMLARYLMYSQVYCHPIRRIYDIHLKDFLKKWLSNGLFSTDISNHLKMTDNEVTSALLSSGKDESDPNYTLAQRITCRQHFKQFYERNPQDIQINLDAGKTIFNSLRTKFGDDSFRHDDYQQKSGAPNFPVRLRDGQIVSSLTVSETLKNLPVVSVDYVFADRSIYEEAKNWLDDNKKELIKPQKEI
jgi:HD superfamily phosphohydrolase